MIRKKVADKPLRVKGRLVTNDQALKLLVDLLQGAIEAGNIERSQDSLFTQYVKDFKTFSRNIDEALGSHPETFYIDLFSTAFTMIAKKSTKDKEMY